MTVTSRISGAPCSLVAQVDDAVKQVPQVAGTSIIGGNWREVRVLLQSCHLVAQSQTVVPCCNRPIASTSWLSTSNKEVVIETGGFLVGAEDVGTPCAVFGGKPVYTPLRDVATIRWTARKNLTNTFFLERVRRRCTGG